MVPRTLSTVSEKNLFDCTTQEQEIEKIDFLIWKKKSNSYLLSGGVEKSFPVFSTPLLLC